MMDAETWLTAEECLSMGLADAIDGSIPSMLDGDELIVNSLRVDTTNYKNKKGLAHCVNKPAPKHKEAGTLTKFEELLNAIGLHIDDIDGCRMVDPKDVESNNTKPASAPVDADKVAADAVAAERQRVAALDAMADGNPTVAAIIDTAKRNGQTAEDVQCYVDAVKGIKNAAQTQLQNMQADAVMGGADSIAPGNVSDKANDDGIMDAIANAMGVKRRKIVMAEYVTTTPGVHYDDLIGSTGVSIVTQNVAVSAGTAMGRGTLMTITSGTAAATAKAGHADAILAAPVSTTDTVATVYVKGMFNREKIIVADSDTVEAHETELRDGGIYLTSLKG